MSASTTIIIPGRVAQTIPDVVLSKEAVIASFAGDVDLSGMAATETREGSSVTIEFANRTGTKGNDLYVSGDLNISVEGDVVLNSTKILIPGRVAQTIPNVAMTASDVRAAFAGGIDLTQMDFQESIEGSTRVISFSNRTGTKGQVNVLDAIFEAVRNAQAQQEEEEFPEEFPEDDFEEDEEDEAEEAVELRNTRIVIPGRVAQVINNVVLDAQLVKNSFSGTIDLSGFNVEEIEDGDTLEVRFTARTGTKGEA